MSKLFKQPGHLIELPNDEVVIDLKVYKSGKLQLAAPHMPPADVCKFLNNIAIDVMFAALGQQQAPKIDTSQSREGNNEEPKDS